VPDGVFLTQQVGDDYRHFYDALEFPQPPRRSAGGTCHSLRSNWRAPACGSSTRSHGHAKRDDVRLRPRVGERHCCADGKEEAVGSSPIGGFKDSANRQVMLAK
jgi:hypothetical protein